MKRKPIKRRVTREKFVFTRIVRDKFNIMPVSDDTIPCFQGTPANPEFQGKFVNFLGRFPIRERIRDFRVNFLPKEVNISLSIGIFCSKVYNSHSYIND